MADGAVSAAWLVDKPAGPTSHDIVSRVRRRLGRGVKVGHTGTLDPFATGLLIILGGRATRLARFLTGLDKTYLATVRLGVRSDSGDPEGPLRPGGPVPSRAAVPAALSGLTGRIRQRPPALSAVRVDGERLYRRARRGEPVEAPAREVEVHAIELLPAGPSADEIELRVRCGSGTYIRSLVADLGEALGCGAYCLALRRTRIGDLDVADAVAPDDVDPSASLPLRRLLAHLPGRELAATEVEEVRHGRPIRGEADERVALWDGPSLVGIARGSGGLLRPEVVLA